MRIVSIFIICGFMALPSTLFAAALTTPASTTNNLSEEVLKKLTSLKIKEVQKLIGRKLTFKEKVSFLILKQTSKRESTTNKGGTALGFGVAALATLLIGLFIPYVLVIAPVAAILAVILGSSARKQDPSDKKAKTGVLLGWITLGAITLALALLIVAAATWGF